MLQAVIAARCASKRTPTLSFHYDDSVERGDRASRGCSIDERAAELVTGEIGEVAAELRSAERFLLTTHENPDGDALGSLLAMHHDPRPRSARTR